MFLVKCLKAEVRLVQLASKGLRQISDSGQLTDLIDAVLSENQDKVTEFREGKDKLLDFSLGK